MIYTLPEDREAPFPPPETAEEEPNGLLAWGGDLHPKRLLQAYSQGIFPWYGGGGPILWWSPDPRAILLTGSVHVSRRLRRTLRNQALEITADRCFERVIRGCALPRADGAGTWITPAMRRAYIRLHQLGHAHSVEVWWDGEFAGGLYGVALGRMFFAESMFSRRANASKVALVTLCARLARWGYPVIDCQINNPHLRRMGVIDVSRSRFLKILKGQIAHPNAWGEDFEAMEIDW